MCGGCRLLLTADAAYTFATWVCACMRCGMRLSPDHRHTCGSGSPAVVWSLSGFREHWQIVAARSQLRLLGTLTLSCPHLSLSLTLNCQPKVGQGSASLSSNGIWALWCKGCGAACSACVSGISSNNQRCVFLSDMRQLLCACAS